MKLAPFSLFAWFNLIYNLLVILFGAYVRATGSGAGCGSHWPTCHGQIIPRPKEVETIIEFTHRLTSGFSLVFVGILFFWAIKLYPPHHEVRRASFWSLVFLVTEALIGAGLVLFQYVGDDASLGRLYWMTLHLINTWLLLASLSLTAFFSSGFLNNSQIKKGFLSKLHMVFLLLLILVGVSGAIAALGDTLFPNARGMRFDIHFYVSLRNFHPFVAVLVTLYLWIILYITRNSPMGVFSLRLGNILFFLSLIQLLAGMTNILLRAPIWLQLVHLLLADLLWIFAVIHYISLKKEHA